MANINILITSNDQTNDHVGRLLRNDSPRQAVAELINYVEGMASGTKAAKMDFQIEGNGAAYASGTLTCTSVVATNTCVVNGVTFTCVASGASGNQFNVGGSNALTAAALAAAINGSVSAGVQNVVQATVSSNVVTIKPLVMGPIGNLCTLTGSANIAASGANLSGGSYTAQIKAYGL